MKQNKHIALKKNFKYNYPVVLISSFDILCIRYIGYYFINLPDTKFHNSLLSMTAMFIPVSIAFILYLCSQREKYLNLLLEENNSIEIGLAEIGKNNDWCNEFKEQKDIFSIKFYELTSIGIEKCLRTLRFDEKDPSLKDFYMTIKLIIVLRNQINFIKDAYALHAQNPIFRNKVLKFLTGKVYPNFIEMAEVSIKESNNLKERLEKRLEYNKKIMDAIRWKAY